MGYKSISLSIELSDGPFTVYSWFNLPVNYMFKNWYTILPVVTLYFYSFTGQSNEVFATQSGDFMKPVVDIGKQFFFNNCWLKHIFCT